MNVGDMHQSFDPTIPVCAVCNDTHRMSFGENGEVMCTFCPIPCQSCRAFGNGPYCQCTPCPCSCHRPQAKEKD